MFHWDCGLKLTRVDLAIDFRRRQPRGFISHAHTDHMARHELALCTPETAALYQLRLGPRPTHLLPWTTETHDERERLWAQCARLTGCEHGRTEPDQEIDGPLPSDA